MNTMVKAAGAVIETHRAGSWVAQIHYRGDRVSFLTGTAKRPGAADQLTRRTGTVEDRETERFGSSNLGFVTYTIREDVTRAEFKINSGRVRMLDDQDAPAAPVVQDVHRKCEHRKTLSADHAADCPVYADGMINSYCTCHYSDARCDELDAPQEETATVEPTPVPAMVIGKRFDVEKYGMRGHANRRSDVVTHWSRRINGKRFDFSRVVWAEGGRTVRVFQGGTTNVLHEWITL